MKQKRFKIILFFILFFLFSLCNYTYAASKKSDNVEKDYVIKNLNVDMVVNENNTYDITETITVEYSNKNSNFTKKIPLKNEIMINNEKKTTSKAKIKNIIIAEEYKVSKENDYEVISILDNSSSGRKTYTLYYTYDVSQDEFFNMDLLYYNLAGVDRNAKIENLSFNITMPKTFDKDMLELYLQEGDSKEYKAINYSVNGNQISGSIKKYLNENQNLIIDMKLPNRYFIGARKNIDFLSLIVMVISTIFLLISDRLWNKYGKSKFVAEIIDSTTPEGLNSAEVGYIYKGKPNDKAVASLLIYLANQGYLKIENEVYFDKNIQDKRGKISIIKLKKYEDENQFESIFLEELFPEDSKKNVISYKELKRKFYNTAKKIKDKFNEDENKSKIFEQKSEEKSNFLVVMAGIIFGLINIKPIIEYIGDIPVLVLVLFHIIALIIALRCYYKYDVLDKVMYLLLAFGFEMVAWANMTLPIIINEPFFLISSFISIVCIITIIVFAKIFECRTRYGNEMLGRIKGFKQFIENIDDDEIDKIMRIDSNYYYNIYPYAYAVDASDIVMKKFEKYNLEKPEWYSTNENFSVKTLNKFLDENMKLTSNSVII